MKGKLTRRVLRGCADFEYGCAPGTAMLGPGEKLATADPVAAMLGTGGTGSADRTNVRKKRQSKTEVVLRVGTVNVGTMHGRSAEVSEMLKERKLDFCCLQETRWKGGSAKQIGSYKFFWVGSKGGDSGVGVMVAQKWTQNVIGVTRINDRLIVVRLSIGKTILNLISVYAPQVGRSMEDKEEFYYELGQVTEKIKEEELIMVCGDLNGHVGERVQGFEAVHGGRGFGVRNLEGEMILEFAEAHKLTVLNTWFLKEDTKKISYESGGCKTVVDYMLTRQRDRTLVPDVNVIGKESFIPQHKLMIGKLFVREQMRRKKQVFKSKPKLWRLKDPRVQREFRTRVEQFGSEREAAENLNVETMWTGMKDNLLTAAEEVCGRTKGKPRHVETWWWNEECAEAVHKKKILFDAQEKAKEEGVSEDEMKKAVYEYRVAKRDAKKVISRAKEAERKKWGEDLDKENEKGRVFKVVKRLVKKNADVVGSGCIKDEAGKIVVEEGELKETWRKYFERLLNEEFDWDRDALEAGLEVSGPIEAVTTVEVRAAIRKMKNDRGSGPSGLVADVLKAAGEVGVNWMTDVCNAVMTEGKIPSDWCKSWMVTVFKGKGDALECGSYRGIKLLEHGMKIFERVLEARLRRNVVIDDMQFGFMPGRGTTDAIFIVRQLQERYLEKNRELWMAFVDLEKAFDRVPREVLWWALREVGVEEHTISVIKTMYVGATTSVKVNGNESTAFEVKVGVHQGSVLSPLLFTIVLEALSNKFRGGLPMEMLYADDLILIAESEELLKKKVRIWKEGMEAKGLRVNLAKTKVLKCGVGCRQVAKSGKYPCGVCRQGVGRNCIQCNKCKSWVHKKCSGITGKLKPDSSFQCKTCVRKGEHGDLVDKKEIDLGSGVVLEQVKSFCYLGDVIGAGGGAEDASRNRVKCGWAKFHDLGCVLKGRGASWSIKGKFYRSCVQKTLLHGTETWPAKMEDMQRLERAEKSMVRWMCGVSLKKGCRSEDLLQRLGVESITSVMRRGRLRWYGHVERKPNTDWTSKCRYVEVEGKCGKGRPRMTFGARVEQDMNLFGLTKEMAQDRDLWRGFHSGKPSNPGVARKS